ncbi:spore germination cell wall hydrolase CwlJ-like protein [Sphingomonas kaistensis]|uniref:Spore germination cell wall hydrolase CwlJ-like protein n=1 Tax=Sphingomonas kaistensis TaxID=298708 RepID=A0A7X5Y6I6_9SPHN|nr:cell wall hydrolase [Sphingomonas kaistensis]NJC05715.1 spore germination cell wall hydrolase CwlJ-like protein [Sphingomonas kaistensis]
MPWPNAGKLVKPAGTDRVGRMKRLLLGKLGLSPSAGGPAVTGEALPRRTHNGALVALVAVAVGGFLLVDPGAKDRAWASLPRPAAVKQPALLQITPVQALERGVQPSALGAARPFEFAPIGTGAREMAEKCLAQAVYYEAGSESEEGQRAVAQVVLNRVRHAAFPNSVCGVVYQGSERTTGCQFTFTCDGSLARVPSRFGWERAMGIARRALAGEVYAPVGHATHYHANYVLPYWASSVAMVGQVGTHIFYSWKGTTGSAAAFGQAYSGLEAIKERVIAPVTGEEPTPIEIAQSLENPALTGKVKGVEALEDPGNADLLNYKAAGNGAASLPDETEVKKAIASAL